jgi:hypothetical protein
VLVKWRGEQAKAVVRHAALEGLKDWSDDVLARSHRVVPEAPSDAPGAGQLKESGRVDIDPAKLRAVVSYDSPKDGRDDGRRQPSVGLAVLVHENMRARHAPGKQAKYLEQPLNETRRSGPEMVRRSIARVLR